MVRKFFKDLDLMIGAGETTAALRRFIGPFVEQFEAVEATAQSGVSRAKYQEAEAEIERLKEALKANVANAQTQVEGYQAQLQQMAVEREQLLRKITALEQERDSQQRNAKQDSGGGLSRAEETVLGFLKPKRLQQYGGPRVSAVAKHIQMGDATAESILQKLRAEGLAESIPGNLDFKEWHRTDAGDEYVAKHGLHNDPAGVTKSMFLTDRG